MPDFVIKTQFRGADKLSPILKRMGISVKQMGDKASRSFKKASRSASVFSGALKAILAAGVIRRGLNMASMAVRGLAEEFLDFDKNITKAVTRLPGQLDRTSKEFVQLSKAARQEAAKTEFTAGQTAAAVEQLALAGFEANEVMGLLPGVLNLATNAGVDVADATRMATKSMGAFGMRAGTTAEKQKALTRINDVFSRAVSSAALDVEGLFETLKFAGPAMFAAGQSVETFAATTELLADRSIDASVAGTSLRRTFIQLAKKDTAKKLKRLGVSVADSSGNFRDFADILGDVGKATEKMGNQQKLATLTTLFGARAVNSINALLDAGSDELKKYRKRLEDAAGASDKMAETIRTSLTVRLQILRSTLIETGIKFITAFTGKAGKGLDKLTEKIRKFDVKPLVEGIKDTARWFRDMWNAIKPLRDNLDVVIGLFITLKTTMMIMTAIPAAKFFLDLAGALWKTAAAAGGVKAFLLGAGLAAGVIIFAILGLVAALTIVIMRFDDVRNGFEEAFSHIEIFMRKVIIKIKQILASFINWTLEKINLLIGAFNKIARRPIEKLELVTLGVDEDVKALKEREKALKSFQEEAAGLGVGRGPAGIRGAVPRGAGGPRAPAVGPPKDLLNAMDRLNREFLLPRQTTPVTGPTASPALDIGQTGEGGGTFRFVFENVPPGLQLKESKTTGSTEVEVEGLGTQ